MDRTTDNQYASKKYLLLDFSKAQHLTDAIYIENSLRKNSETCGSTVLEIIPHSFDYDSEVIDIVLLTESHIIIHTWPEKGFITSLAIEPQDANIREITCDA